MPFFEHVDYEIRLSPGLEVVVHRPRSQNKNPYLAFFVQRYGITRVYEKRVI